MTRNNLKTAIEGIVSLACTEAIANLLPPGSYPLDVAIIEKASTKTLALVDKRTDEKVVRNKSFCGCSMCEFHTSAYALKEATGE